MAGTKKPQNGLAGSPLSSNVFDSKEQERFLPIANVSRIMKKSLPANAKISKEAKEIVQECVSEFISIITGEASDKCQREKRKTINGDDLLWAMTTLGFENYVNPLKLYLNKYRENEGSTDIQGSPNNNMMVIEDHDHRHQLIPPYNSNHCTSDQQILQGIVMPNLLQSTDSVYYPIDAKLASRMLGNGIPSRLDGISKIHEIEGNDANRVITSNLHHEVGW
ncbi:OLC1v1009057C1 [Oldenlandia corymbosa var. corymbosa]|uniref:OLC1v1009057C1 n=1 Tax=Oldenlandia corymbosa var. corymbosa TaxID=529605 RepID=A0AAV1DN58_OLDCO|nr:OLC1v1009057C1 [Oldenlandia corymbosa var. corymbosa]